jgi:hypothetical protein
MVHMRLIVHAIGARAETTHPHEASDVVVISLRQSS